MTGHTWCQCVELAAVRPRLSPCVYRWSTPVVCRTYSKGIRCACWTKTPDYGIDHLILYNKLERYELVKNRNSQKHKDPSTFWPLMNHKNHRNNWNIHCKLCGLQIATCLVMCKNIVLTIARSPASPPARQPASPQARKPASPQARKPARKGSHTRYNVNSLNQCPRFGLRKSFNVCKKHQKLFSSKALSLYKDDPRTTRFIFAKFIRPPDNRLMT